MKVDDMIEKIESEFSTDILSKKVFRAEITFTLNKEVIRSVMLYCRDSLGYNMLLDICSLDHYGSEPRFEIVYQLYSLVSGSHLRIKCQASEDSAEVDTVSDIWATANWHEREIWDLMGIRFTNHPNLRRILMWEGYPYHPLRKDFPLEGLPSDVTDVAFTEPAPLSGGPFVTQPTHQGTPNREPRSRSHLNPLD